MKVSVTREYTWEMGHALNNHAGKCFRPHGHNYRLKVEVSGLLDTTSDMVIDFADLDGVVKPMIDDLDHQFLANRDDDRFQKSPGYIPWDGEPTAESIALYLYASLSQQTALTVERVTLYETDKASATVRRT